MAIELKKGGDTHRIDLTKRTGSNLNGEITINLDWSEGKKSGFLGLFKKAIDLDLGCFYEMRDGSKMLIDGLQFSHGRGGDRDRQTRQGCYTKPPYNKYLVTVSGDGYAKIWDAENGCSIKYIFLNDPLGAVDISPDGNHILIGGKHNAYILNFDAGKVISKIHGANMPIWSVKFLNSAEFVFADNSRLWHGEFIPTDELIKEARKLCTE